MPITPATTTPIRTMAAMTIRTIFRTVLPDVVGGGGTFRYGGLGGIGAPAVIVIPRAFSLFLSRRTRLLHGGGEVDEKEWRREPTGLTRDQLHHHWIPRA